VIAALVLLVVSIVLAILAITGYDRYLTLKIKAKMLKEKYRYQSNIDKIMDSYTRSVIKKVKLSRIGSYLVLTIVMREGVGEEEVSVSDLTPLMPLVLEDNENENINVA